MKGNVNPRRVPVVVPTASKADEDIGRGYDLHTNSYSTKPVDFEMARSSVYQIEEFRLKVVTSPRN